MKTLDSITAYYTGFGLAVFSTILIGLGFIFKKLALIRAGSCALRAGDGGLVYLRDWIWWLGLSLFAMGEGANFIAYALAPASLVTPLGGLSVLFSALLSARFLNERLNTVAKLGCFICLLGSTLIVLHAPKEQKIDSLIQLQQKFFDQAFLIYASSILVMDFLLILIIGPRSGRSNPLIYILISASLGSLSVMACKGIGVAVQEAVLFGPLPVLHSWFFWLLIGMLLFGLLVQLYYLNRALDLFNTGLVTALLYVFFTGFVLSASALLFQEWSNLDPLDYVELTVGLLLITLGVFMMTVLKSIEIEWKGLTNLYSVVHKSLAKQRKRHEATLNLLSSRLHFKRSSPRKSRHSPLMCKDTACLISADSTSSTSPEQYNHASDASILRQCYVAAEVV